MSMSVSRRMKQAMGLSLVGVWLAAWGTGAALGAPTLPEIRMSAQNRVPACVTPERLMAFLRTRNGSLTPRFRDIAHHYKRHGEAWRVRWDYAFFQMAIETNFLTYRAPSGRMGDVDPKQNNFAGIGTTGGGVPGDSFPDVSTGVLGQIQHLVVYSGETIADPVAPRTRLKQEHILAHSLKLNRPVRFSDLARRWAADPKYAGSIEWVAARFRADYCKGRGGPPQEEVEILPWHQKPPAAPARKRVGAADGAVPARADTSAVRTIWSREAQSAAAAPAVAPPPAARAPAVRETASIATMPEAPAAAAVRGRDDAAAVALPGSPDAGRPAAADHGERFALFTPPSGLAAATMAGGAMGASPPDAPEVPDAPQAVAGNTVGGFLLGVTSKPAFPPPSGLGVKPGRCVVETATFGGETTVLVKTPVGADVHYVALSVLDGFEDSMTKSFLAARDGGGEALGVFPSKHAALAQARTLCPAE